MSTDYPAWLIKLVAGLDRYDREHPKLYAQYATSSDYQMTDCACYLIRDVPADVLAYARGWQDGVDSATQPTAAVEPTTGGTP